MPSDPSLPLSFAEEHRLRHYAGLVALHLGLTFRCVLLGDFWNASRNHSMAMEAARLAGAEGGTPSRNPS